MRIAAAMLALLFAASCAAGESAVGVEELRAEVDDPEVGASAAAILEAVFGG